MTDIADRLKSHISVFSLVISVIVAWLLVPPIAGPPVIALFILFASVASLIYFVRQKKSWFDTVLYRGIVALSFFLVYRANPFIQFFDIVFILFFGSLLIRPLLEEYSIFSIILSPLIVIANSVSSKNIFPFTFELPTKRVEKYHLHELVPTILVTFVVFVITIPLLSSANPFFNSLVQHILNFFNLTWLFKYLFTDPFEVYVARALAAGVFLFAIPRILTISVEGTKDPLSKQLFSINYLYPKIALAGLLIIFFITQLQLYFASSETLRSIGYTNSRLTNEVFFQVTIVAFIVSFLAYMDKTRKKWNTVLTYFLTVEAFFLIGIAFKSVYDYSTLNGFTEKRLWGYTSMAWLTGILIAFIVYYKNQSPHLRFIKQALTYTVAIVLLVNLINFDYLIYHVSKPTVAGSVDYGYLANLSPDGHYNKEALQIAMNEAEKSKLLDTAKNNVVYTLLSNIDLLKYKYKEKKVVNTFNISEYQEYLTVKDIDTESYRRRITEAQEKNILKNPPAITQ